MAPRVDLHLILKTILGGNAVYFQPPPTVEINYPCIIYERSDIDISYANNFPYNIEKQYKVTVIDRNPDSSIPDKIALLPKCRFDRHFTVNNLNHDVFEIYY